jgi:hypothetical protein
VGTSRGELITVHVPSTSSSMENDYSASEVNEISTDVESSCKAYIFWGIEVINALPYTLALA